MKKINVILVLLAIALFIAMPYLTTAEAPNPQYPDTIATVTGYGTVTWDCDSCDMNFTQTIIVVYGAPTAEYIARKHAAVLHIEQQIGKPRTLESNIEDAIIKYRWENGYQVTSIYMPRYSSI